MKKRWIISANYLNRSSPFKYLVRRENQPIETARAFKFVEGKNVKVEQPWGGETGFGCRVVMVATSVVCKDGENTPDFNSADSEEPSAPVNVDLKFDFNRFVGPDNHKVTGGESISLSDDGMVMTNPY